MGFLQVLSVLFGCIYTISWSVSFYPQPILNYRRKTTAGSVMDFPFVNTFGFGAYFVYNAAFYWSPVIRAQYAARNHGHTPTVAFNDLIFAGHATVVCAVLVTQYFFPSLWGFTRVPNNRPSRFILGVTAGCFLAILAIIFVVCSVPPSAADPARDWAWIDVMYTVSYVKLLITVIKYAPQLLHNFRNRSTKGWAISTMLLDFAGGVLSIAQLVIDSYLAGDWSGITGNPAKFLLGNVSMLYDIAFMLQHYVLYRHNNGDDDENGKRGTGERDALLESGGNPRRWED